MKNSLILILLITGFTYAQVQVGSTTLDEREVVDGLDVPWEIKWGPDSGNGEDFSLTWSRYFLGFRKVTGSTL